MTTQNYLASYANKSIFFLFWSLQNYHIPKHKQCPYLAPNVICH